MLNLYSGTVNPWRRAPATVFGRNVTWAVGEAVQANSAKEFARIGFHSALMPKIELDDAAEPPRVPFGFGVSGDTP